MDGPADDRAVARQRAAEGWGHLTALFRDGVPRLSEAVQAFREAERLRRLAGAGEDFVPTLLGLSLALRLLRDPDEARRAVVLAQELVNVVRRDRGDAEALPYRSALEAAYRDLAEVERGDAAIRAAEEGIDACDRTIALARRLHVPDVIPASQAAKAALLTRLAAVVRPPAAARTLHRDAERLYRAALGVWPARDVEGRAVAELEYAEALAEGGDAARAERLAQDAVELLRGVPNRYLRARAARAEARAALATGRPDALDLLQAAAAAFRALGCEWDARQVEALL